MLKVITILSCLMIILISAMPSNIETSETAGSIIEEQTTETQTNEPESEPQADVKQLQTDQPIPSIPTYVYTSFLNKHFFHPTGLRTIIRPEIIKIHEPALAKIGDVVQRIPTAVSHQSQTIVHKHAKVFTPIVAPAVKTHTHQILRSYTTPLVYAPSSPYFQFIQQS